MHKKCFRVNPAFRQHFRRTDCATLEITLRVKISFEVKYKEIAGAREFTADDGRSSEETTVVFWKGQLVNITSDISF